MASKKPTTPPKRVVGKGPAIPPKPSRKQIEAVLDEIREQCFGEDEEQTVWNEKLTEELDLPFKALLMPDSGRRNAPPRPVEVLNVSESDDGPIAEVRLADGTEVPVRLKDLIPVDAAEDTVLLLHSYREWVKGRDDFENDDDEEDDGFEDDDEDFDDDDDDDDWKDDEEDLVASTTTDTPDVLDDDLDEFPELGGELEAEGEEEEEEEEAPAEDDEHPVGEEGDFGEEDEEDEDRLRRGAKKPAGKKGAKEEKPAKKPAAKEEPKPAAKKLVAVKEEPKPAAKKPAAKEEPKLAAKKPAAKEEPKPAAKKLVVVKEEPKPAAKKPAAKEEPKKPTKKK